MLIYRVFSLTWLASMQIYWNKRKRLHKKKVQLPEDCFGTPTWPPFHCFGTPIWPPWLHVKTLYICVDFVQGACTESLDSQVQGATTHPPPHPPMKLMTSQSLPLSSVSSVMIISHLIDLAGLAHGKNSLTLHCFLTWNSNQSDKISPPYPPSFHTKQVSHPPTDRSGPGLSADTKQDSKPTGFFSGLVLWLEHGQCPSRSSITQIYIYKYIYRYVDLN